MCNSFKIRPAHFSCGGEKFSNSLLGCGSVGITKNKHHKKQASQKINITKNKHHKKQTSQKTNITKNKHHKKQTSQKTNITENKHHKKQTLSLSGYFIRFIKIRSCKPRCAPASPAAHLQCSTARI